MIYAFLGVLAAANFWCGRLMAQEMLVPVCEGILVITSDMAKGVADFASYPDFQQATVFKAPDNTLIMEILYKMDGTIVKMRKPMSREDIDLVCMKLKTKIALQVDEEIDPDRDGRRKIIGSTMAYSLLYYAWAIPTAFNLTSGSAYTGSYLLIGSAGYFIPMLATQNSIITKGMAKGYTYGCFLGIPHGWALGSLITNDDNASLGISVLTSIGEGLGGLYYARNHHLSRAHMSTIGSMGTWGLLYGLGFPAMAESESGNAYAGSSLAISALGIYAGDKLARKFKPAEGDVTVINGLGLLGTYLPFPLIYSFAGEDGSPAAYIGSCILGSIAGLSLGFNKTSKVNYTRSEGNIILLGEISGGLVGAGTGALLQANTTTISWLIGAGLVGGFLISDNVTLKKKHKNSILGGGFSFDFNPMAFQKLIRKESFTYQPGNPFQNPDLLKLRLRL